MTIVVTNQELVLIFLETRIPNKMLHDMCSVQRMKRTKSTKISRLRETCGLFQIVSEFETKVKRNHINRRGAHREPVFSIKKKHFTAPKMYVTFKPSNFLFQMNPQLKCK